MHCRAHLVIAACCILAVPAGWAVSPYYPHPAFVQPFAPPATYPYARLPLAPYPRFGYRSPGRTATLPRPTPAPGQRPPGQLTEPPRRTRPAPAEREAVPEEVPVSTQTVDDGAEERRLGDHQAAFLDDLQPLVERENARLLELREELSRLIAALDGGEVLPDAARRRLQEMARQYRVDGDPLSDTEARWELLNRVDAVPASLALAQAANESAWGQSRFAREGNNLFGIWTYDESKGIVPRNRAPGKKHLVRRFDSIEASVRYYLFTLNSHPAYAQLRTIRATLRAQGRPLDGHALADGLTKYSAKGDDYVRLIQAMIRRFDLAAYDDAGGRKA